MRRHPELHIIFDEAYTEMSYVEMPSLLAVAPDLKSRIIILRSATKAWSAAGERLAIILGFDDELMNELLAENINMTGHASRSGQRAYAETMAYFDKKEHESRLAFYKEKVMYVSERLKGMGAAMPDAAYKIEGTFYVLADLSDLLEGNYQKKPHVL